MSTEWDARDEQPILPTSTNFCITKVAGTQGHKVVVSLYFVAFYLAFKVRTYLINVLILIWLY
jgi:hypothetical protein